MNKYTVKLSVLEKEFSLQVVNRSTDYDNIEITTPDINRPAIQLAGFYEYFGEKRMQIMGTVETEYMKSLTHEQRLESFDKFFSWNIPALVICHGKETLDECLEMARKHNKSVLSTDRDTSDFIAGLVLSLKNHLAPRITRHGVLVEVYGEGILLLGESGVGKSETAIELVKRGHRLIADDAVELKKISDNDLIGTAPEMIRHYVELRGIGVVNVRKLYGMGAVKTAEKVDLVVNLEQWQEEMVYDRLGIENQYMTIMGVDVPSLTVPVKPGRNLAVIVEVAAMNNRQKKLGNNTAAEFSQRVNEFFDVGFSESF
ncbi:MAG: HPr(Ser) kinase/phosphatase [Clostridiales bacterium]|nr:HPr(Ser) kinase/phosphatase [Clostridiales bacterium]